MPDHIKVRHSLKNACSSKFPVVAQDSTENQTALHVNSFQIVSHSNFLEKSNYFMFDQNYKKNYKDLLQQIDILLKYI